jgi:NAD(P)-dependent dehydrogenase (short-subunit alcohol dehydrogenase family)
MDGNPFDLTGRVALVTGGNSGIGRAIARAYVAAGASVAVTGRRSERNRDAVAELGERAAAFDLDVRDEDAVARTVAAVVERFGRLDILVNNAGTVKRASILEAELADWEMVLATNLTGPFLCTKYAARFMAAQRSGKIINIASVYGLVGPSRGLLIGYTASKHGLIGLTRANAVELAPLGIQVNAIAPGWYLTEMNQELRGTPFEKVVERRTPAGAWGTTDQLGAACIYLGSSASDYVTGTTLTVDGGYAASDGLDRG